MAGDQPKVLADIADIIMGQSPSGDFVSIQPEGLPLLNGPSEFTNYVPLPVQFTTDPKRIAVKGDLLFCVRGSTTGRMNWSDREYAIGRGLASIRAKMPGTAPAIRGIIEKALPALLPAATGSTFPNVGRLQLEMLPLPEGIGGLLASISTIVGSIDDKIELNRRMATTLEEIARAIFRIWFVDFDPVCAKVEGRDIRLPSDIAAVFPSRFARDGLPEGWNEQSMLDQATWVNGAAYKDMNFSDSPDALPVIKIGELKNGIGEGTKWTNTNLGDRYRITDGELLFSWSGSPDTSIDAFVWVHGDAWLNQHIFAVRPNGYASQGLLFAMLKERLKNLQLFA